MSRTPETVVNLKKQAIQEKFYGVGFFFGICAFAMFYNDVNGLGSLLTLFAIILMFIGSKIKTHYRKVAEHGVYR